MSENKNVLRVAISGAAGQIGYSLIPMVANGSVFGADQHIRLHLLDIAPMMDKLKGVKMEIDDCGFALVDEVICTADAKEAFDGVNYAILVGGFPRRKGMLRKDLLAKNSPIFKGQGQALNEKAADDVRVLVVANPANTNCLVLAQNAPRIPKSRFSALTRLDHHRASAQVALKLGVNVSAVKNVIIWGNHSKSLYPDLSRATVTMDGKEQKVLDVADAKWVQEEFVGTVQQRGAAVIAARGLSSAMSAANAAAAHVRSWHQGTKPGEHVSMAIYSDGSKYGIADGIIFSFPVTIQNGEVSVVEGVEWSRDAEAKIRASEQELVGEKSDANEVAA